MLKHTEISCLGSATKLREGEHKIQIVYCQQDVIYDQILNKLQVSFLKTGLLNQG